METVGTKDGTKSEIQEFFNGMNVFLTGGTGAVGQVVLEKLLRACPVRKVYLLVRPKKNKGLETRAQELFAAKLFDRLRDEQPGFAERVELVLGNCDEPDLGISERDQEVLITHVNVVIHSAATVNFNEPLKRATLLNIRSTRDLLVLSRRMNALKAFVYISTAYSNCNQDHIKEIIYENHINGDTLIKMAETMSDSLMDSLTDKCLGTWPNTYTLTKCIAENMVYQYGKNMPVCIVRPSIVMCTFNEPLPGWTNSIIGANGLSLGVGLGAIRVTLLKKDMKLAMVPSDKLANLIITSAWHVAMNSQNTPVYNYVSNNMAPELRGRTCFDSIVKTVKEKKYFSNNQVWYPGITYTESKLLYYVLFVLLHYIPAIFADVYLRFAGKKIRALKIYQKIYKMQLTMSAFTLHELKFDDQNVMDLISRQTNYDKVLFDINLANMQWKSFFDSCVRACLQNILHEPGTPNVEMWKRTLVLYYGFNAVMTIFLFYLVYFVLNSIF